MSHLSLFTDSTLDTPLTDLLGESVAILGIKGSGKSNTAARLSEQMLAAGVPMVIVDIAGEYRWLKQRFALIVAGKGDEVDIELTTPGQAAALAVWSLRERMSVILDLSDYDEDLPFDILKAYFFALWKEARKLRRPYQILVEECHNFVPQGGSTPLTHLLTKIATEGRKRGLGIVMIGQRSARIDKNVLTQAGILMLHRVRHPSDISVYQDIVPEEKRRVKECVTGLATGEILLVTHTQVVVAQVLERETYHAGYTPGMDEVQTPTLTSVPTETIAALRDLLGNAEELPMLADSRVERLQATIDEQMARIAALELEKAELLQQVALLGNLKLEVAMPHMMAVDTLSAAQVVAPNGNGVSAQSDLPVQAALMGEDDYRTDLAITRAKKRQEREFTALLTDVLKLKFHAHRRLLRFLLERTDREFSLRQVAASLDYQTTTLLKNPPTELLQWQLIQRRIADTHYFTAQKTRGYLHQRYPDLDADALIQQIIAVI